MTPGGDIPFSILTNGTILFVATESIETSHTIEIRTIDTVIYKIDEKYLPDLGVGKSTTGTVYTIDDKNLTAAEGAEIFNSYTNNKAIGEYSHAEGKSTTASGRYSHAEGFLTTASGIDGSHAEGYVTTASGFYSHAEGRDTIASGNSAHAEGQSTTASGVGSHAEGAATIASSANQHVQGKYNIEDTNDVYAHIVGNGEYSDDNSARSNAHTLDWDGNAEFQGDVKANACGGATPISLVELYNTIQTLTTRIETLESQLAAQTAETWTFTLEDGTTTTKNVVTEE